MLEWVSAILQGALGNLASDAAKTILERAETQRPVAGDPFADLDAGPQPDSADEAESLRFLTRQRTIHRTDLAREKWRWLILTAHYHPKRGRTDLLPEQWDPRLIGNQFTVTDFAGRHLPHEDDIGEHAPSNVRVALLHTRIQVVANLRRSIAALEDAIDAKMQNVGVPEPPWPEPAIRHCWAAFLAEVTGRRFTDLPNFNSYCGFKNLWTVSDTPAGGMRLRLEARGRANLFAYAAVMELASRITRSHYRELYRKALEDGRGSPHQWAQRKVAVAVLKDLWVTHAERWINRCRLGA